DDAGGLAAEARIVLPLEARRRLFAERGQLGAAVEPGPGWRRAPSAPAAATATFAGLDLTELAERHQPAPGPARVDHDDLFGCPVAGDVRLAGGTPQRPRGVRDNHRASHLLDSALWSLDVLAVAIHVAAVVELDRVEIAGVGIGPFGGGPARAGLDRDPRANRKQLLAPARPAQHVHRAHLAPMMRDASVRVGDVKIE